MDNIQYISLDINNNKISEDIYIKQYDVGREIVFTVTEDGNQKDLTGTHATFELKKPDGFIVFDGVIIETNRIHLITTEQMSVEYGKLPYQLSIYTGNNTVISTVTGTFFVDQAVFQRNDIESTSEWGAFTQAMNDFANLEDLAEMQAIAERVHDEYQTIDEKIDNFEGDITAAEEAARLSKSYAVGGEGINHGTYPDDEDNSKYYLEQTRALYNRLLVSTKVVLYYNQWNNNTQTVTVEGVVPDEDAQLVTVRPQQVSIEEYMDCNVYAIQQGDGTLTFTCSVQPEHNLYVYVMIQTITSAAVNMYGRSAPSNANGINGNIYTQYTDRGVGTVYAKVDNQWYPIGSGGGGVYRDFIGATASTPGDHGLVPAPSAGDQNKFLCGDGTWKEVQGGGSGTGSATRQMAITEGTRSYSTTTAHGEVDE